MIRNLVPGEEYNFVKFRIEFYSGCQVKNKSKNLIDSRTTDFMHASWDNIIPLQKYEKWSFAVGKKNWEFSACAFKRLVWQITGVVPEKLIVFNAVRLSIANLRFPRALIYERREFKQAWPTLRRFFQALSTDADRRNTPRPVWNPSHRTGCFIFTLLSFFRCPSNTSLYANSKYSQN